MRVAIICLSLLPVLIQSFRDCALSTQLICTPSACSRLISFSMKTSHSNLDPVNTNIHFRRERSNHIAAAAVALSSTLLFPRVNKAEVNREESTYVDVENGFSVLRLPGWSIMPKQPPTISLQKFQPEEVLFVASSFLEGASLTVSRTNVGRLLKDFNVDWWFAPMTSINDVGSPELTSGLLSLQHQGVSEKRGIPERVFSSTFVSDSEFEKREKPMVKKAMIKKDVLTFEYLTPLAGTDCKTVAKAYFRNNNLMVVWISALSSVFDLDYGEQLNVILDSFVLTDIERKK